MTREEARQKIIDIIDWHVQDALDRMCLEIDVDEYYDALDTLYDGPRGNLISRDDAIAAVTMAALEDKDEIEALKALPSVQPSGDLISRADAIEAVRVLRDTDGDIWGEALDALFALPSAEAPKPTEDLICRADAIGVVRKKLQDWAGYAFEDYRRGLYEAQDILESLPSAEATCATCADRAMCIMSDDGNWKACKDYRSSAEAVQGDAISKRFISDAILQKISELNTQGEKGIPIAREFIRFKRFVDGITPNRAETVQGEWEMCEDEDGIYGNCSVCGCDADFSHYGVPYNFCPNCGAKMKGGDDE